MSTEDVPTLTKTQIENMKVTDLREECRHRNLPTSGTKQVLQQRLLEYISSSVEETEEIEKMNAEIAEQANEDEEDEDENDQHEQIEQNEEENHDLDPNDPTQTNHNNEEEEEQQQQNEETKKDNTNNLLLLNKSLDEHFDSNNDNVKSFTTMSKTLGESNIDQLIKKTVRQARFANNENDLKIKKRQEKFNNPATTDNDNNNDKSKQKVNANDFTINSLFEGADTTNESALKEIMSNEILKKRKERFNNNHNENNTNDESNNNHEIEMIDQNGNKINNIDPKVKERLLRFNMDNEEQIKKRMERFDSKAIIMVDDKQFRGRNRNNNHNEDLLLDKTLDSFIHDRSRSRDRFRGRGRGRGGQRGRGRGRGRLNGGNRGDNMYQYNNRNNNGRNFNENNNNHNHHNNNNNNNNNEREYDLVNGPVDDNIKMQQRKERFASK